MATAVKSANNRYSSPPVCVDLATGTGDVAFLLAQRFKNANVLGLDLTEAMIEVANQRNSHINAYFAIADMTATGLKDESVDIVTGSYALRNAPTLSVAIEEIHRILKPGGTAAFLDFTKSPNKAIANLQALILKCWGGFWGLVLHHGRPEHAYIGESLKLFPDDASLCNLMEAKGFRISKRCYFFAGTLMLLVVQK